MSDTPEEDVGGMPEFEGKFPLGLVVATPGVLAAIQSNEIENALHRHQRGEWGDLDEHDWAENQRSLLEGFRLFSQFISSAGVKFWIITEHDRSVTTVLLPQEY